MRMRSLLGLALLISSGAAAEDSKETAVSQPVFSSVDATAVEQLLREVGDDVVVSKDPTGAPLLEVRHKGMAYQVLFYKCEGSQCKALQFRTTYVLATPPRISALNDFNRTKLYGRALRNDAEQTTFEMMVWLTGGVTWQHLRARRDWFYEGVRVFDKHLADTTP